MIPAPSPPPCWRVNRHSAAPAPGQVAGSTSGVELPGLAVLQKASVKVPLATGSHLGQMGVGGGRGTPFVNKSGNSGGPSPGQCGPWPKCDAEAHAARKEVCDPPLNVASEGLGGSEAQLLVGRAGLAAGLHLCRRGGRRAKWSLRPHVSLSLSNVRHHAFLISQGCSKLQTSPGRGGARHQQGAAPADLHAIVAIRNHPGLRPSPGRREDPRTP